MIWVVSQGMQYRTTTSLKQASCLCQSESKGGTHYKILVCAAFENLLDRDGAVLPSASIVKKMHLIGNR